jgi:hypothetical protein
MNVTRSGVVKIVALVALAISLAFPTAAIAGGSKGGGSKGGGGSKPAAMNKGNKGPAMKKAGANKFKGGYYYKGKHNHHWHTHRYYADYGCELYNDGDEWYYWCQPDDCYYPVSYCPYGKYNW